MGIMIKNVNKRVRPPEAAFSESSSETLEVEFKNGVYQYYNVSADLRSDDDVRVCRQVPKRLYQADVSVR